MLLAEHCPCSFHDYSRLLAKSFVLLVHCHLWHQLSWWSSFDWWGGGSTSSYDRMVHSLPSFISWLRKATKVRWTHKKFAQNNWKGSGFTYFSHVRYYYTIPLMSCPLTLSGQYFPTPFSWQSRQLPCFLKRKKGGSNFTWEISNLIIWTDYNLSWLSWSSFVRGNNSTVCLLFVARRVVTFVGGIMIKSQSGCSLLDIWGRKGELCDMQPHIHHAVHDV